MTDTPFLEELSLEEARFKRFSVSGTGRVKVAGDLRTGLAVNIDRRAGGEEESECPCGVTVTFHGVQVDCGCWSEGDFSIIYTDNAINENTGAINRIILPCSEDGCWVNGNIETVDWVRARLYDHADCTDPPYFDDFLGEFACVLSLIDGLWYLSFGLMQVPGGNPVFLAMFYGTNDTPTGTFINLLSACNSTRVSIVNPWQPCNLQPTPIDVVALGHSGTATVVLQESCGACCSGTDCYQASQTICEDNLSGVFQGEDTSCDPNPCE